MKIKYLKLCKLQLFILNAMSSEYFMRLFHKYIRIGNIYCLIKFLIITKLLLSDIITFIQNYTLIKFKNLRKIYAVC